jgi:hypothetical protein
MRKLLGLGLSVGIAIAALIGADYLYFKGFDDGADASLCAMALAVDGDKAVQNEASCKRIAGRKPPPRIFSGSSGDEPTIWRTTTPPISPNKED